MLLRKECFVFLVFVYFATTAVSVVGTGSTIIETAVIYDEYYKNSVSSFNRAIEQSALKIRVKEFFQQNMTNIVGKWEWPLRSTYFLNCFKLQLFFLA